MAAASAWRRALARAGDAVLDPTVVFAFDQTGFRRHAVQFDPADLPVDLDGRQVVVTGANSGLGLAASEALLSMGAELWMVCRDRARGEAARERLAASTGRTARLLLADMADLDAVAALARALPARVHVLVHNAGALLPERRLSPQGLEQTLATHLVGPYALTARLRRRLAGDAAQPGRVVWVSSGGMYPRRLSVERIERVAGPFDGVCAYADVKRAQVVLNELLGPRLRAEGARSFAMHPGWAGTPGVRGALPVFFAVTRQILRTPAEGADTIVWLAASEAAGRQPGGFWFDRRPAPLYPLPGTREDPEERERLWQAVQRWSGLPWEEGAGPG